MPAQFVRVGAFIASTVGEKTQPIREPVETPFQSNPMGYAAAALGAEEGCAALRRRYFPGPTRNLASK